MEQVFAGRFVLTIVHEHRPVLATLADLASFLTHFPLEGQLCHVPCGLYSASMAGQSWDTWDGMNICTSAGYLMPFPGTATPFLGWFSYAQGSKVVTPRRVSTGIEFMALVWGWRFLRCSLAGNATLLYPVLPKAAQEMGGGRTLQYMPGGVSPLIYCIKD